MGCCVSTSATKSAAQNPLYTNSRQNRTPPLPHHPLLEEESVKEVLSETPAVPKKPTILKAHQENIDPKKFSNSVLPNIPSNPDEKLRNEGGLKKPISVFNPEEVPEEASEICSSFSGSVSTATYCTEKNDDDGGGDNRQRSFRHRSLSGDSRRERVVGKSPSKRSEPSPARVRSGSGRDARGLGANNGQRKDFGERSARRSRSPATRSDSGGGAKMGLVRSGSAGRSGKSPGRVKSEMGDKIRRVEDPNSNFNTSCRESRENKWPPTSNESLENPLVSLECFIFL